MANHNDHINLIWQIADLLRGPYRPPQYERVMLPMIVLRRFDCVLAPTKEAVLNEYLQLESKYQGQDGVIDSRLNKISKQQFHNHSPLSFERLRGAPDSIKQDLVSYINGFSANVRRIFEYFEFEKEIERMDEANILYLVVSKFSTVDLRPKIDGHDHVTNVQMGMIFEHLIRKFNELANETAGDHFTPREVVRLMVDLLFMHDDAILTIPGTVRTMLDPACGTGGMLAEAQAYLRNPEKKAKAQLYTYGQDYNKRAFATAASDMLIKEVAHNGRGENIKFGDSLIDDQFKGEKFDYLITNPPFGVDWKKQQAEITREHEKLGENGRFGAGLPRVNDGALLFLQHMISKFEPVDEANLKYGSRLAIVFSGSPLFSGGAGSGESNIRRWIIENDWLEAIVALPEQMFYNTGIGAYVWIVTNHKERRRKGKIQLLDAREFFIPMRRSLGDKRREISDKQIVDIVRLYGQFEKTKTVRIFDNTDFGFTRVTIERPLRLRYQLTVEDKARFLNACPHLLDDVQIIDKTLGRDPLSDWNEVEKQIRKIIVLKWKSTEHKLFRDVFTCRDLNAAPVRKGKNDYEPDPGLRDFENIPLAENIDEYFQRNVVPHLSDAWMDRSKDKIGYEINFNRLFYVHRPPRKLQVIDNELKSVEEEILKLLKEVTNERR